MKFFAVSAPGLVDLTTAELQQLGMIQPGSAVAPSPGTRIPTAELPDSETSAGVPFEGDLPALYRANLHLRTASRVLLRLGEFRTTTFADLRRRARDLSWERYLHPGQPTAMHVTCRKSRLYHSDAVAERVAGAIGDRLGRPTPILRPDDAAVGAPPQLVVVRLANDLCTISIDSSGALLHRRGYRLATAKAPLRETLAAGLILASGWDAAAPLLDPFCGSGTIPIEAALLAAGIPPGYARRFAFMDWPGYNSLEWKSLVEKFQPRLPGELPPIHASDRDAGAIKLACANAERAGVASLIQFKRQAVSSIEPPAGPGWVICNPPYGLRVRSGQDLRNLYARFGDVLRERCSGWKIAILASDLRLLGQTRLNLETTRTFVNGGIAVRVGRGVIAD